MSYHRDHEGVRRQLWADVAVGVASASNSVKESSCWIWADKVLREFDKRFPREQEERE